MLSRRNIRIKVMQSLYAYELDSDMSLADAQQKYKDGIDRSYNLFLFSLHIIGQICDFASTDEKWRKDKYLPNENDKAFKSIFSSNPLSQSLIHDEFLLKRAKQKSFEKLYDKDLLKSLYQDFSQGEEYQAYSTKDEWSDEEHMEIFHALLRFLKKKESFNDILEDAFPNWIDDKSLVLGAIKKTFKALPLKEGWLRDFYPDSETVQEFGEQLFVKAASHREEMEEIIKPKLKNWNIDRLALIDKLCLEMAIIEFIHFTTIPVKVTINEYVDLSKRYSTDNSKEFINGLLDKVKADLLDSGKIVKQGRGLQQ